VREKLIIFSYGQYNGNIHFISFPKIQLSSRSMLGLQEICKKCKSFQEKNLTLCDVMAMLVALPALRLFGTVLVTLGSL